MSTAETIGAWRVVHGCDIVRLPTAGAIPTRVRRICASGMYGGGVGWKRPQCAGMTPRVMSVSASRAASGVSFRAALRALLGIAGAALSAGVPPAATALPAFGRGYDLDCGACHSALPRLNAYGRAFRERGYVLPGTAPVPPLPVTSAPLAAAARGLGFWVRGPVVERSDFRRGRNRTDIEAPSSVSAYLVSPLPAHTYLLVEGGAVLHQIESTAGGHFSRTTEITLARGFASVDLAAMLRTLGGVAGEPGIGAGVGPIVTVGRFDPSSLFAYPTRRDVLHSIPGDTEGSKNGSDIQRFPLVPYAFGARFFGLFDRSGEVLLPTTESLFNTRGNLGAAIHGRLAALPPLLWSVGFLNGAAPRFPDTGDTVDPYAMLRYDVTAGEASGSISVLVDYGPGTAEVRYTGREAADGRAGRRTVDWLRTGIAAAVSHRALELRGAFLYDELFRVPGAIEAGFDATSAGVSLEADYRITADWLASLRYDWMDPGGFSSTLAGLDGPLSGQALHMQLRWYFMQGRTRPRSAPVLAALSLRDSVNLAPGGGTNPLRAWENVVAIGIDVAH